MVTKMNSLETKNKLVQLNELSAKIKESLEEWALLAAGLGLPADPVALARELTVKPSTTEESSESWESSSEWESSETC